MKRRWYEGGRRSCVRREEDGGVGLGGGRGGGVKEGGKGQGYMRSMNRRGGGREETSDRREWEGVGEGKEEVKEERKEGNAEEVVGHEQKKNNTRMEEEEEEEDVRENEGGDWIRSENSEKRSGENLSQVSDNCLAACG